MARPGAPPTKMAHDKIRAHWQSFRQATVSELPQAVSLAAQFFSVIFPLHSSLVSTVTTQRAVENRLQKYMSKILSERSTRVRMRDHGWPPLTRSQRKSARANQQARQSKVFEGPTMHVLLIEPGTAERNYRHDLWRYRELFYIFPCGDISA